EALGPGQLFVAERDGRRRGGRGRRAGVRVHGGLGEGGVGLDRRRGLGCGRGRAAGAGALLKQLVSLDFRHVGLVALLHLLGQGLGPLELGRGRRAGAGRRRRADRAGTRRAGRSRSGSGRSTRGGGRGGLIQSLDVLVTGNFFGRGRVTLLDAGFQVGGKLGVGRRRGRGGRGRGAGGSSWC